MSSEPSEPAATPTLKQYKGIMYDPADPRFAGLSKNAVKRLLKEDLWQQTREARSQAQREKHKRKRVERAKMAEQGLIEPLPKRVKAKDMVIGDRKIVIDCAFSEYMTDKEMDSIQTQLVRCYSANRMAKEAAELVMTGFDDRLKQTLEKKTPTYDKWTHVRWETEPYDKLFEKDKLVYLSADSDNVAHELDPEKIYIIGGIVDKNRHKNLCQKKAAAQGIATAQLPIGDYIQMASRKVLTVNQVYEIMLKWIEHRDWQKAFQEVIPQRKLKDSTIVSDKGSASDALEDAAAAETDTNDTSPAANSAPVSPSA
ncbi:guanine-1-methyltransferase-domain-containing protein [Gongronella butleri]|nr:guanine-1-methyltransferase-domain-containing protein [Gongronella butleri]